MKTGIYVGSYHFLNILINKADTYNEQLALADADNKSIIEDSLLFFFIVELSLKSILKNKKLKIRRGGLVSVMI